MEFIISTFIYLLRFIHLNDDIFENIWKKVNIIIYYLLFQIIFIIKYIIYDLINLILIKKMINFYRDIAEDTYVKKNDL